MKKFCSYVFLCLVFCLVSFSFTLAQPEAAETQTIVPVDETIQPKDTQVITPIDEASDPAETSAVAPIDEPTDQASTQTIIPINETTSPTPINGDVASDTGSTLASVAVIALVAGCCGYLWFRSAKKK